VLPRGDRNPAITPLVGKPRSNDPPDRGFFRAGGEVAYPCRFWRVPPACAGLRADPQTATTPEAKKYGPTSRKPGWRSQVI